MRHTGPRHRAFGGITPSNLYESLTLNVQKRYVFSDALLQRCLHFAGNQSLCQPPVALAVAAERVCTFNFSKIAFKCLLTVLVVITNFSAISLFVKPWASRSSTSRSRSFNALNSLWDW